MLAWWDHPLKHTTVFDQQPVAVRFHSWLLLIHTQDAALLIWFQFAVFPSKPVFLPAFTIDTTLVTRLRLVYLLQVLSRFFQSQKLSWSYKKLNCVRSTDSRSRNWRLTWLTWLSWCGWLVAQPIESFHFSVCQADDAGDRYDPLMRGRPVSSCLLVSFAGSHVIFWGCRATSEIDLG